MIAREQLSTAPLTEFAGVAVAEGGVRDCYASLTLLDAVNRRWPSRSTAGDGTIAPSRIPNRRSDHDAWMVLDSVGVRRARDIEVDGIDAGWLAEQLRRLGAAGDPRLNNGGYVIFNGRITSGDWRIWRHYTGVDPHVGHIHVSFSLSRAGFDSAAPWIFLEEDTVTPQDLRAVVNGVLDTPVAVSSAKAGYTTMREVIVQLHRLSFPVTLLETVSQDLAVLQQTVTELAKATSTTGAEAQTREGSS